MSSSSEAKAALLGYLRFQRQMPYVATEVYITAGAIADVAASNGKNLIEYEIKVSYSDFRADFKKEKHIYYVNKPIVFDENKASKGDLKWEIKEGADRYGNKGIFIFDPNTNEKYPYHSFKTVDLAKEWITENYAKKDDVPNQLYYVMPKDMWELHKEKIEPMLKGYYGVITFINSEWGNMEVVKLAKKLHNETVSKDKLLTIVKRMSSELAGIVKMHYDWVNDFNKFKEFTQKEFDLKDIAEDKDE